MHLEKLTLGNFRSFEYVEIPLYKDLTILVGENNGGKSNAIDAMRLLTMPLGGRRELYCEPSDVRFGCANRKFEIVGNFNDLNPGQQGRLITAASDPAISGCVFGLRYDESAGRFPVRPTLWGGAHQGTPEPGSHDMIRHVYLPPLRDAKRALASGNPTRIYALLNHFLDGGDPDALAKALGRSAGADILVKVNGAVETGLSALTSGVRRQAAALGFASDEKLIDIARDLRFKLADHGVEPEDLRYSGHGYANLLYMATIAVELERANDADLTLFLVEEPEAHLHPQLQAAVLTFLEEQAEKSRRPRESDDGPAGELQVVVATHSPNLSAWVESTRIVFFRTTRVQPVAADASEVSGENATDVDTTPIAPPARRTTRCIPLAELALDDVERRKVDRYLDVTKSALLFGGRVLLVEGIAEALLLPVLAKRFVLKNDAEKLRRFRSAVFVPIDGVDFEPYVKLLLSSVKDVCIAERLVVLTDGDGGGLTPGEDAPGALRKKSLDGIAVELKASAIFEAVISDYSLESELVRSGNGALMRESYLKLHPRSAEKWDNAIALAGDAQAAAVQKVFETTRKGDFAQLLADDIAKGRDFVVPDYLRNAINSLVA